MNVALLVVDCLRADHLSPELTPNILGEGRSWTRFSACHANAFRTPESAVSLASSTYPSRYRGVGLSDDQTPIAELLADEYATGLFHCNPNLHGNFGYDRGFDTVTDFGVKDEKDDKIVASNPVKGRLRVLAERLGVSKGDALWQLGANVVGGLGQTDPMEYAPAEDLIAAFEDWKPDDREYFAWLHFMDVHTPYTVRDDYLDTDVDRAVLERVAGVSITPNQEFTDEEIAAIRALYRSHVRYVDEQIGPLVDRLLAEDTAVIVLSDHGEHIYDHRPEFGHIPSIWDEIIRVPLLIHVPGVDGGVVDAPVELLDVPPTIADLAGVDVPASYRGESLLGDGLATDRTPVFGEYMDNYQDLSLVFCDDGATRIGYYVLRDEWVRLGDERDTIETVDAAAVQPFADAIHGHLDEASDEFETVELDDSVEDRLSELGYM